MEKELAKEILRFTSQYKRFLVASAEYDFYDYFFLSLYEEVSDETPVIAMSYRNLLTFGLPTVMYGPKLLDYINELSEKDFPFIQDYIRKVRHVRLSNKDSKILIRKFAVFREFIKHEVIHYINLHLPRTIEFFRNRQVTLTPQLLLLANIEADRIANRYLNRDFVLATGGIPALEDEPALEKLLEKLLERIVWVEIKFGGQNGDQDGSDENQNQDQDGEGQSQGDKGKDQGQKKNKGGSDFNDDLSDFTQKEAKELEKKGKGSLERIKEVVKNVVERVIRQAGTVPSEIEEVVKWLGQKTIRLKIENGEELFSTFREIERTYLANNPLNRNPYGLVFPAYRPLKGSKVALIVDTSGSMGPDDLQYVFSLLNSILKQSEIYLVEIDAQIQRIRKVCSCPREISFKGRGGTVFTDLERLPQLLPKDIKVVVLLTDGFVADFPKKNPIQSAKWIGLTTVEIPSNSPQWIRWFRIENLNLESE